MSLRTPLARLLISTILLGAFIAADASAAPGVKKKSRGKDKAAAEEKKDSPFKPWAKVTKGTEEIAGYFTIYKKPDKIYLAVSEDQLDADFLGMSTLSQGIGVNLLLGGMPLNDRLLNFKRVGNRLMLIEKNSKFIAPEGSAIEKALDISHGHSVLHSFKIESIHDETKALLIEATPLLTSDLANMAEYFHMTFDNMSVRLDKDRSAVTLVKGFPENVEFEASLTFTPTSLHAPPGGFVPRWSTDPLESVPDNRYIPVTVHYSFSKLPETPMLPRLSDERVGQYMTPVKDFSKDRAQDFWQRNIIRWRLEKKDPTATLSEPVKPIVWYVDHTVPEEYRQTVKKAIENWQKAFEAAGFKNAIIAKMAPDDPDWDAEDARYTTLRWIVSDRRSFGAIGPARNDPRTGEILDADILVEAGMIQGFRNAYRQYVNPQTIAESVMPTHNAWPAYAQRHRACMAQMGMADGGAMMRIHMLANDLVPPGGEVPEEYVHEALTWVVMHEVGHSLGLQHNFRSSTATPVEKVHDRAWTEKHGLTGSVMDYAAPNISVDPSKQGEYYGSCVGDYDVWAIRYGYTPSGKIDVDADYAFARKIADESLMPGHDFASDFDTYPANALDPRVNIWDIGSDPLLFADNQAGYIRKLLTSDGFEARILGSNGPYSTLRGAVNTLLWQYGRSAGLAIKYVGGQYFERVHRGQPGAVDPLTPLAASQQREALAFIGERVFAADAFELSPQLLNRLAPERWEHWGTLDPYDPNARVDYNWRERVFALQNAVVRQLTAPKLLARLSEAENRSADPFTMAEHFRTMTASLWGEVGAVVGPGMRALGEPTTRRQLQRAYIDKLAEIMISPSAGTPDDARALARLQLSRIDARARRALGAEGLNDALQAHMLESRARIKQSLEANRSADARGGRAIEE